jgi:excisionase family DNA binding protein
MGLRQADYVSRLLDIPKARVYELVRRGILPAVRIGERQIRFDEDALREWIERGGSVTVLDDLPAKQFQRAST